MNIKEGEKLLQAFVEKCEQDEDVYLAVHFSREQDEFQGLYGDMDELDAAIIIKYLVDKFKINPMLIFPTLIESAN